MPILSDTTAIHHKAQQHLAQGRAEQAEELYRQLLSQTSVIEHEYNEWLESAARAYRTLCRDREAAFIYVYLGRLDRARDLCSVEEHAEDVARILELQARPLRGSALARARPLLLEAASLYAKAGQNVMAAIAYEQAGENLLARQRFERVLVDERLRGRAYEQGLVHFNLGLLSFRAGDKEEASRHLVRAQHTLEDVADEFESRGERERAFDCYSVLMQIGRELGSYENLAEGYINCIRVLKEDNLKFYVLKYYEDFLRISLEREEYHAAATLLREAADYTRRVGLIWDREYLRRCGETWWRAAEKSQAAGGPVKLVENAYLSAIDAWSSIGDFYRVRETYRRLQKLALPDKKRERYARLFENYQAHAWEADIDVPAFPEYLRQQHVYPEIWHIDLIEWEQDGDPLRVAASIVGDVRYPEVVRRRALHVLLLQLHLGARAGQPRGLDADARQRVREQIISGLGSLETYAALRPLERMYDDPNPRVRQAAVDALRSLSYKRAFQLIMRALGDDDAGVREAAVRAIRHLHFPSSVDALIRIFEESHDLRVKMAALESLGRVGDLAAGEFLIQVLRHETDPLSDVARRLLLHYDNPDILPILRRYHEMESGRTREILEGILRGR